MAITYLGEQHFGSANDANTTTDPLVLDTSVAPFNTLSSGDVVVVYVSWRVTTGTASVSVTGGQTWNEQFDAASNMMHALYSCVFNGTWGANPQFDYSATATGGIGWAVAYSGVDQTTQWDVTPVQAAQASSTTYIESAWSTSTDGALAFCGAVSSDNNTWTVNNSFTAPSGSGNIYWQNAAGLDSSLVLVTKAMPTAGAVGATTMTQATVGADSGQRWHGALKPAAADPNATATPSTIAATVSVPTATKLAGAITVVSAVAATTTVGAPTLQAAAIATPSTIAVAASVPAPTVQGAAITQPATMAATVAVLTPDVLTGGTPATATPATVAVTASVPAPTLQGTAVTQPATTAVAAALPAPTIIAAASATVTPATIAIAATIPAPTILVGGNATATPATIAVAAALLAPTLASDRTATPTTVAIAASVGAPTPQGTATVTGITITGVVALPAPNVFSGEQAQPVKGPTRVTSLVGDDNAIVGIPS